MSVSICPWYTIVRKWEWVLNVCVHISMVSLLVDGSLMSVHMSVVSHHEEMGVG